nr:Rieske 2Fe-2S domain-containing protein [Ktedonobacterales bacterium]
LLSFIFFLSASWNVHPYFFGPDIVFFFAWLPVMLAGAGHLALPAVDEAITTWLLARSTPDQRRWLAPTLAFVLGADVAPPAPASTNPNVVATGPAPKGARAANRAGARPRVQRAALARREFLWGAGAGGVGMLGLAWLWNALHPATAVPSPVAVATEVGGSPTATTTATNIIAQSSTIAKNSAVAFTIPTTGDPGVLVRTTAGKLVAFNASCTHEGCPVQFDPNSQLLQCPCHGAAFDPAQDAAVVQGPAQTPLAPLTITVDQKSGNVTLA